MVLIDSWDCTHFKPGRAHHEARDQIGQDQRLAREMGGDAQQPRHDDGDRKVVDQLGHGRRLPFASAEATANLISASANGLAMTSQISASSPDTRSRWSA